MSDDRIRKLYRSYAANHAGRRVLRHRGKSPRQAAFFFRNAEVNFQATQLASLLMLYGLLGGTALGIEARYRVGSLDSGALFCKAYEAYAELHVPAAISFEHAWFLLLALARRDEIGIAHCPKCGGVRLRDVLAKHHSSCPNCDVAGVPAFAGGPEPA